MVKKFVGQDQVAHRANQLVPGHLDIPDRLAFHLFRIDIQRHGHGAVVFRLCKRIEGALLAGLGKLKAHFAA